MAQFVKNCKQSLPSEALVSKFSVHLPFAAGSTMSDMTCLL